MASSKLQIIVHTKKKREGEKPRGQEKVRVYFCPLIRKV
jgi:hypothetical protein